MRIADFDERLANDEEHGTTDALDALEALIDHEGRDDDGRAQFEADEEEAYLELGGKRLYTPEARAERQRALAEQIRAGDVREVVYHLDGQVTVELPDGTVHPDRILTNNREDQREARKADSRARVGGWFT